MKHTLKVTLALVAFFFLAQVVGLMIVNQYIDHKKTVEAKEIVYKPLPYNLERPQVENQSYSFIYIVIAILVGTSLILLLIKFRETSLFKLWLYLGILRIIGYASLFLSKDYTILALYLIIDLLVGFLIWKFKLTMQDFWKFWFFITVWITLSIAFSAFINTIVAVIIGLVMSALKLYRPNIILQNLSEIFIYGGLAAIFVPIINIFAAVMLLIVISIYDFIAVFKTKHMVKLAEFQSSSKIFAGLLIPYERGRISVKSRMPPKTKTEKTANKKTHKQSVAVLGGGDIGFTLIFAGVVMKALMLQDTFLIGFLKTLIIPVFVTIALFILLMKGQQNKFYPAMPVLSLGCFVGYLVVWLI
ncbi:MAG: presenilin family intramembrane aspartyl protease [Nanoarchaeota archaeon]